MGIQTIISFIEKISQLVNVELLPQIPLLAGWCNSYQQSSDHPGTDNTLYQTAAPWSSHLFVLLHLHKVVLSTSRYSLKQKPTSLDSTNIQKVIIEMAIDRRNGQLHEKFQTGWLTCQLVLPFLEKWRHRIETVESNEVCVRRFKKNN